MRAYRSATRIGPAPLSGSEPTRQQTRSKTVGLPTVVTVGCVSWAVNSCDCWVERLQPFVGFGPVGPSWSAINSAPDSQLKTHQQQREINLSLRVLKQVLNWQWSSEATSSEKWEIRNSVSEATSKEDFAKIHSEREIRKFNIFFYRIVV